MNNVWWRIRFAIHRSRIRTQNAGLPTVPSRRRVLDVPEHPQEAPWPLPPPQEPKRAPTAPDRDPDRVPA